MEVNITTKLKTAIIDAMLQLIPDTSAQTEALTSTIIEGTRATHKLRGDIKVAMATVQRLQSQNVFLHSDRTLVMSHSN